VAPVRAAAIEPAMAPIVSVSPPQRTAKVIAASTESWAAAE
jgi:hypothetical protein